MNNEELIKEKDQKSAVNYPDLLARVEQLWRIVKQRDDTKTVLYDSMDKMLGPDKLDHRNYKNWFSDPVEYLLQANLTDMKIQQRAWVMISALVKALLHMITFYDTIIMDATDKMNRIIAQLQMAEQLQKDVEPANSPEHGKQ